MGKKLDLNGVRIYSNTDNGIKDAIDLIGQEVYMSDYDVFFPYHKCELIGVTCIKDDPYYGLYPFICNGEDTIHRAYKYFILAKDAKFVGEEGSKEKKLRPFKSMREFFDETGFDIGDVVQIRRFGAYTYEEKSIFNGFRVFIDEESHNISVIFGSCSHSFKDLHQNFEYQKNNKWLPFGVEDDE